MSCGDLIPNFMKIRYGIQQQRAEKSNLFVTIAQNLHGAFAQLQRSSMFSVLALSYITLSELWSTGMPCFIKVISLAWVSFPVIRRLIQLTFKRRIKSHLPFAGIIRSSTYSPRFQDNG